MDKALPAAIWQPWCVIQKRLVRCVTPIAITGPSEGFGKHWLHRFGTADVRFRVIVNFCTHVESRVMHAAASR
jgi:hypothetical protein